MKILVNDIPNNQDQFIQVHAGDYYGGSDVAAICGINPFSTPLDVWMKKTGRKPPIEQTPQMRWGQLAEEAIGQLFAETTGLEVYRPQQTWQSDDYDWQIVSPDLVIDGNSIGEIKTHKIYADEYWGPDKASDMAQAQLQWALGVAGISQGYCIALIGGDTDKFYYPMFEYDYGLFNQMAEQVDRFREFVRTDTPPMIKAEDTDNIKLLLKGKELKGSIDLSTDFREKMEKYKAILPTYESCKSSLALYEGQIKALKNDLLVAAKGAAEAKIGDWTVKFNKVVVKAHEVKASEYYKTTIKGASENGRK